MLQIDARNRPSTELFAPWVEWQRETCRRGRQLITAVNHRDGIAIQVDSDDLDQATSRGAPLSDTAQLLRSGGFLMPVANEPDADRVHRPLANRVWV